MNKNYVGYFIIGATNADDAENEKGLMLWSTTKPSGLVRFLNRMLLNIYWVDKERNAVTTKETNPDVQFNKVRWEKKPTESKPTRRVKTKIQVKDETNTNG
jgi:hypothetical protein